MIPARFEYAPAWTLACWLIVSTARAFPGVLVDESGERRLVNTTHVVIVTGERRSVVTVMVDYEGPRSRFALVLPVPTDVETRHVKTLRREIVSRVEQVSAPRLHEFYEKDPCQPGPPQQAWEERLQPTNRGFLTSPMLPPPDASYRVSNEMSVPSRPVFKGEESEFSHTVLRVSNVPRLQAELTRRGYRISAAALEKLEHELGPDSRLLLSEVQIDRVELVGNGAMQLGGIRYTTSEQLPAIKTGLGVIHSAGMQDLFVYVLDEKERYEADKFANVFAPTNVAVLAEPRLDLGQAYNVLFDRAGFSPAAGLPQSGKPTFVTEYAWSTEGCGEPCPNAPLQLRELLSLGGDELEARRTKSDLHGSADATEPLDVDERALMERRALIARQRYLLTRLHYRYAPTDAVGAVQLRKASGHVLGGVGVPSGPSAQLSTDVKPASTSRFQGRFVAAHPWTGSSPCEKPERWRWGKRWKSMGRVSRQVPLALDLPRSAREPVALRKALVRPVAGLEPERPPPPPTPAAAPSAHDADVRSDGCGMSRRTSGGGWGLLALVAFARQFRQRFARRRPRAP